MSFTASTTTWTVSESTPDAPAGTMTTTTVTVLTTTTTTTASASVTLPLPDAAQDAPQASHTGTSKRRAMLVDLTRDETCSLKLDTDSKRSGGFFEMPK